MIIFTKGGETPESIAHEYLGYNDASKAKQIRDANVGNLAAALMPGTGIYASNRALWFPVDGESVSPQDQADIVREFDWLSAPQRDMLTRLQHNQINLHHVANAHHATKQVNLLMGLSGFGTEALHSGVEVAIKAREHLESAVVRSKPN